jgi:hypothetical protein
MSVEIPKDPELVSEVDKALDAFEKDLAGLPKLISEEAPIYLYMSLEDLRKKTPDELSEICLMLNRYSLNLQRVMNRLRAWERWCVSSLDSMEARYIPDVPDRYGFNERPKIARHNPEPCKKINEFLRKTQMQLLRLDGVPNQIRIIADSIKDLKFAAIRREKEYAR